MSRSLQSLLLVLLVVACAEQGRPTKGAIYVLVDGVETKNNATKVFEHTVGSTAIKEMNVIVGNQGDAPLYVQSITLEPDGNDYISIDPPFSLAEFPKTIQVGDLYSGTAIKFKVRYAPGTKSDPRASVVKISSSDMDIGIFTITFMPEQAGCRLKVTPDNYTFVGATASSPQFQEFEICNVGNDTCVIEAMSFDQPTSEFTLINVPKKGTKIDPEGSGLGNPCVTFTVRYAPNDTPDEIYVVIKSNDSSEPDKKVKLQGETELGEVEVGWVDPDCVDFSAQTSPGDSCTKIVNILNVGKGAVTLDKPYIVPSTADAYSVQWFKGGGTQSVACGPYNGTEITTSTYVMPAGSSVDVAVTYVAPGAKGQNGSLVIKYRTPIPGSQEVHLCGGAPKCEFQIAPPANSLLVFHAKDGEAQSKHFVIMNKGNGPLLVRSVTFEKQYPAVDPDAYTIKTKVADEEVPPYGLLPVEVEFSTAGGFPEPIVNGTVHVTYQDCVTGADVTEDMQVLGHNNDWEGVELPVAKCKAISSTGSFKVNETFTLDASDSIGGSFAIPKHGAYTFFVYSKPTDSRIFLSVPGNNEPKVQVKPDAPGTYDFRLWLFTADSDGSHFYYSNEAVCTVQVQP